MAIQVWFEKSLHKVFPNETPRPRSAAHIYAARNEEEACQLVLQATADCTVKTDFSPVVNAAGESLPAEVFEVLYLQAGSHGVWADPLRPAEGTLKLRAGEARALLWRIHTDTASAPGEYTGSAAVTTEDGTRQVYPLTVTVWNFALPATPSCQTAFGLRRDVLEEYYGLAKDSAESRAMYAKYYESLLAHKISAYALPADIRSDEANAYMDDPRVTGFTIPLADTDEELNQYFGKLRQKREWFSKAYFYALDEPSGKASYERMEQISARLSRLEPNFRQVIPFYMNPQFDIRLHAVESMTGKVRIWCPESNTWDDLNAWDKIGRGPDSSLGPKMRARQAAGDTVWWYVCCGPREPYCNLHISMQGILHRLLFWQQMQKQVEGLLYWSTNWWIKDTGTADPWTDMATVKDIDPDLYGDGSLFYPGPEGPLPSFRLECIRDGIEDYEYLKMAEERLGRDFVNDTIRQVTTSLTEYDTDEEHFEEVRIRLGQALEQVWNG